MQSHLSNPWNNAVAFLAMSYRDARLYSGSCFFWAAESQTYLVTNWHNLAGRDPLSGRPLSSTAGLPDRAIFMAYKPISGPDEFGHFDLEYVPVEVKLCNEDLTNPLWFEHPEFGPNVDVAAIDVSNLVAGLHLRHVNTLESDAVLDVTASQDLFVVGFPFGQMANAPAPIWKRGTVALDPTFDPDGVPKMLIDTATREGMSGSVVIARHIVAAREYPKKDGTKHSTLYARLDLVAGIYSGRNYPDLERAQLGIVWKRRVIEETIAGKKVASV